METQEAISKIKEDLAAVKAQCSEAVQIDNLLSYLAQIEKDASFSMDSRRLQYQGQLAEYDAKVKSDIEMFKSVIESGKESINAILIVNGGAVIALLGFLANTISKGGSSILAAKLSNSLLMFGLGVLAAAIAFGVRYLAQFTYASHWRKAGHFFNGCSWLIVTFAYVAFGIGLYCAYYSLSSYFG